MSNLTLLYNNKSDSATLTGGSWETSLPLSNMQDTLLHKTARSSNLTLSNTLFTVDFGTSPPLYTTVALLSHNLSVTATIRVRAGDDVSFATYDYDSGWRDAFLYSIPTPETDWESDNWWFGKPSEEDLEGYSLNSTFRLPLLSDYRYVRVEIDDSSNTDGYVEIGRLMISPHHEFAVNMDFGASLSWVDESKVTKSISGVEYFDVKPKHRQFDCTTSFMSDNEALSKIFEIQKRLGVTGQVFVSPDTDDDLNSFRTSFLARMTKLDGIKKYIHGLNQTSYSFKELL